MLEKILSHLLPRVNMPANRQVRRGAGHVVAFAVTAMFSTLRLDLVIALAPSIRPRPVSSQVSYRCVFASLQLIPQWACV
jgi:hypothetical protein